MKKMMVTLVLWALILLLPGYATAGSDVAFPQGWESWVSVNTPLTKIGALPGCDADVSGLLPIYQETVATYCSVRAGGPGKVAVLVNPKAQKAYEARNGNFSDGPNLILHLKDMKVLFVIGHSGGEAKYGVFTEAGKDITASDGPLATKTCINCHTGYKAFCVAGQCGKVVKK